MPYIIKHGIATVLLLIFCSVLFIESQGYPHSAARFPQILLVLIAALAIGMFTEAILKQMKDETKDKLKKINKRRVIIFSIIIILYVVLIDVLGYFALTPIFIFCSLIYLKATRISSALFMSIGFTIFVYALFSAFLNIPLPKGMF